jgi:hypothetical protein
VIFWDRDGGDDVSAKSIVGNAAKVREARLFQLEIPHLPR